MRDNPRSSTYQLKYREARGCMLLPEWWCALFLGLPLTDSKHFYVLWLGILCALYTFQSGILKTSLIAHYIDFMTPSHFSN